MGLRKRVIQGGSHAQSTVYRHWQGWPRTDGRGVGKKSGAQPERGQMFTFNLDAFGLRGGSSADVALRRLCANEGRAVGGNRTPGAFGYLARVRQVATRRQSGLGCRRSQAVARAQATRGNGSPFGSLLWLAHGRPQGDLLISGQSE